jgi:hypothetical protein
MKSFLRAFLVLACLAAGSPSLRADEHGIVSAVEFRALATADVLVERPVGLCLFVTGIAAFVGTLPFAALGGNVSETADKFVARPFRYTFVRPLGHFED